MRVDFEQLRRLTRITGFAAFAMTSILVTSLIWNTLENNDSSGVREYVAEFRDVSGLHVNDHVRVAGVRVGEVKRIDLDGETARVTFSVDEDQPVLATTRVAVRYQNLIGQRFLSLEIPARPGERLQEPDDVIPVARTDDSLDLSRLLNGFQPIFELLPPDEINDLADSLILAFEGQGPALDRALDQIARLAGTFSGRDQVFAAVADNITPVLEQFARSGDEYRSLLAQSQRLVDGLVRERRSLGDAIDGITGLVVSVSGLVDRVREPGRRSVEALNEAMATFVPQAALLRKILKRLPGFLDAFGRVSMHGSWLDLYPCHLDGTVPGVLPDDFFSDVGGHHHSEVCR